jgi:hypothetical protein
VADTIFRIKVQGCTIRMTLEAPGWQWQPEQDSDECRLLAQLATDLSSDYRYSLVDASPGYLLTSDLAEELGGEAILPPVPPSRGQGSGVRGQESGVRSQEAGGKEPLSGAEVREARQVRQRLREGLRADLFAPGQRREATRAYHELKRLLEACIPNKAGKGHHDDRTGAPCRPGAQAPAPAPDNLRGRLAQLKARTAALFSKSAGSAGKAIPPGKAPPPSKALPPGKAAPPARAPSPSKAPLPSKAAPPAKAAAPPAHGQLPQSRLALTDLVASYDMKATEARLAKIGKTLADAAELPHPTSKAALATWRAVLPSLNYAAQLQLLKHYGLEPPAGLDLSTKAGQAALLSHIPQILRAHAYRLVNGDVGDAIKREKGNHATVAKLQQMPDTGSADLRRQAQEMEPEIDKVTAAVTAAMKAGAYGDVGKGSTQRRALQEKQKALRDRASALDREHMEGVRAALRIPEGEASPITVTDAGAASDSMASVRRAADFYASLVRKGPGGETLPGIKVVTKGNRASYNASAGHVLNARQGMPDRVAIHELGHAIEGNMPGALAASLAFAAYRTKGSPTVKMADVMPTRGYHQSETGNKDHFDRALPAEAAYYCGKDYGGVGSEILSVGIEHLYADPAGFAQKDPEYAAFIVGLLNGSLRFKEIPDE